MDVSHKNNAWQLSSPFGYKYRAVIESPLVWTNFNSQRPTRPSKAIVY